MIAAGMQPLVFCLTTVMILTLTMALLGMPIVDVARYGAVVAILAAAAWTVFQLARTPARVSFRNDLVQVRSALEVPLKPERARRDWQFVIDLEERPGTVRVTIGHTSLEFLRKDWPDFEEMVKHFHASKAAFTRRAEAV